MLSIWFNWNYAREKKKKRKERKTQIATKNESISVQKSSLSPFSISIYQLNQTWFFRGFWSWLYFSGEPTLSYMYITWTFQYVSKSVLISRLLRSLTLYLKIMARGIQLKTIYSPLFMVGVQLSQGYRVTARRQFTSYLLPWSVYVVIRIFENL